MADLYVLLGDVVDSRKIDDRAAFERTLRSACREITATHDDTFAAPLKPVKGIDEVGGALTTPAPLYDVLDGLRTRLHPHELRVAVVRGVVDVGVDTGDVSRMDGPAFHRADELVSKLDASPLRVALDLDSAPLETAIADEVNLLFDAKSRWTDRQREIVESYRETESQRETANKLGVSQAAVSRALSRASWPTIREVETRLRATLQAV